MKTVRILLVVQVVAALVLVAVSGYPQNTRLQAQSADVVSSDNNEEIVGGPVTRAPRRKAPHQVDENAEVKGVKPAPQTPKPKNDALDEDDNEGEVQSSQKKQTPKTKNDAVDEDDDNEEDPGAKPGPVTRPSKGGSQSNQGKQTRAPKGGAFDDDVEVKSSQGKQTRPPKNGINDALEDAVEAKSSQKKVTKHSKDGINDALEDAVEVEGTN